MFVRHLDGRLVHATDDLLRSHALRDSLPPFVNQTLQAQALRATEGHDRHLRTAIDESLERVPVHLHVHVQHDHAAERLGGVLHRHLVVFVDVALVNHLLDLPLSLHVERVRVQQVNLRLPPRLLLHLLLVKQTQDFLELRVVVPHDRAVQLWKHLGDLRKLRGVPFKKPDVLSGVHRGTVAGVDRERVASTRTGSRAGSRGLLLYEHDDVVFPEPVTRERPGLDDFPTGHEDLVPRRYVRLRLEDRLEVLDLRARVHLHVHDLVILRRNHELHAWRFGSRGLRCYPRSESIWAPYTGSGIDCCD